MNDYNVLLVIHMDPVDTKDPLVFRAKEYIDEIIRDIDGVESFHDVRAVSGPTHTNIVFDIVVEYSCKYKDEELKEMISAKLKKFDPTFNAVMNIDHKFA
ncbi:MAG: hypothetical protein MJ150_06750 [Clostridia bacterium]|nr:hypothetical protein [Clostridia bacterium]